MTPSRRSIKVLRRASREIAEASAWWAANRPAVSEVFKEDLRLAFKNLSSYPFIGKLVEEAKFPGVRRIYLSRIRYHLYYRVSADDKAVEILALWHASRGTGPGV